MTALQIRRIPFRFDETVPFQWHPTNPEFGVMMNAVTFLAIAFERYIVAAMRDVMPQLDDPEVASEARAFLQQEALHARAHQLHADALIARYPGLQGTLDEAVATYQPLLARKPLAFHLAYVAGLEATFTPSFKMMLDHRHALFEPGDGRVASLFTWHFVEEIEHRSSALVIYDALVPRKGYRLRVAPRALLHVMGIYGRVIDGFHRHVPRADSIIDVRRVHPWRGELLRIAERLPLVGRRVPPHPFPAAYAEVPRADVRETLRGVLRSQVPSHDPEHQPLPACADEWLEAYRRGDDMTRFIGANATA